MAPVSSRRSAVDFVPENSPRSYLIAPMTWRQRVAFQADLTREAGAEPGADAVRDAMRAAIRELNPENAAELLELLDRQQETPDDADLIARITALEAALGTVPVVAELLAARARVRGLTPFHAARHALRGWSGPGLPAFRQERGAVPPDLIDEAVPPDELMAIGWKAFAMAYLTADAEGNSAAPSPSPATPATSPAA